MGPLAAHRLRTTSPTLQARGGRWAEGFPGGVTAEAPPNAVLLAGWPRGKGELPWRGALPRYQGHKVSSKDFTEEQRNGMRWVSVLPSVIFIPFLSWQEWL